MSCANPPVLTVAEGPKPPKNVITTAQALQMSKQPA